MSGVSRLGAFLWYVIVAVVIGLAVAVSAARLLLPEMSGYRAELEALASSKVPYDIRIGALDAAWQGLSPVLALKDVQVVGDGLPAGVLDVDEIHVAMDLWQSLLAWQWRTRTIDLVGIKLTLYRTLDGLVSQ